MSDDTTPAEFSMPTHFNGHVLYVNGLVWWCKKCYHSFETAESADLFTCLVDCCWYHANLDEERKALPATQDHGSNCDHRQCPSCWSAACRSRKCLYCGHDWSDPEQKNARVR